MVLVEWSLKEMCNQAESPEMVQVSSIPMTSNRGQDLMPQSASRDAVTVGVKAAYPGS